MMDPQLFLRQSNSHFLDNFNVARNPYFFNAQQDNMYFLPKSENTSRIGLKKSELKNSVSQHASSNTEESGNKDKSSRMVLNQTPQIGQQNSFAPGQMKANQENFNKSFDNHGSSFALTLPFKNSENHSLLLSEFPGILAQRPVFPCKPNLNLSSPQETSPSICASAKCVLDGCNFPRNFQSKRSCTPPLNSPASFQKETTSSFSQSCHPLSPLFNTAFVSTFPNPWIPFPDLNISPTEKCFPEDLSTLVPNWLKFEHIMLTNQLLKAHYIQAITNSFQIKSSSSMPTQNKDHRKFKKEAHPQNTSWIKPNDAVKNVQKNSCAEMSLRDANKTQSQIKHLRFACDDRIQAFPCSHVKLPCSDSLKLWETGKQPYEGELQNVKPVQKGGTDWKSSFTDASFFPSRDKVALKNFEFSSAYVNTLCGKDNYSAIPLTKTQHPENCKPTSKLYSNQLQFRNSSTSSQEDDRISTKSQNIRLSSMKEKRSHRCFYCGKLYSRKYGLKIHIRTHTGYKPLKCKICGRPFGDPSNLNKHVRLHAEGETPYRCQFCGKVLVRRRDLERHINSRHPERKTEFMIGSQSDCPPADPRLWSVK